MIEIGFTKMHGLGNDFVIIDERIEAVKLTTNDAIKIADRRKGIGCDQVIVISHSKAADCFMSIYNSDGTCVDACGNATRCVAYIIMEDFEKNMVLVETNAGILQCMRATSNSTVITVNMGKPKIKWQDIPLAKECNTLHLPITLDESLKVLYGPIAVNVGNPHVVLFVEDNVFVENFAIVKIGSSIEKHDLLIQGANVSFVNIHAKLNNILQLEVRVWERGVGETNAYGTAACAVTIASILCNIADPNDVVHVNLKGGVLEMSVKNGEIFMTGNTSRVFKGSVVM